MGDYHEIPESEDEELELELESMARLSVRERYEAAIRLSLLMIEMMERHGHREADTVLQRP